MVLKEGYGGRQPLLPQGYLKGFQGVSQQHKVLFSFFKNVFKTRSQHNEIIVCSYAILYENNIHQQKKNSDEGSWEIVFIKWGFLALPVPIWGLSM